MVIVNESSMVSWRDQNVHLNVYNWFTENNGKWITDCASALGLTYEQVAWALGYNATNRIYPYTTLPTSDNELSLAAQLNAMWQN